MLRHSSAIPVFGRGLLACTLCLLAFAFAMEAKMAWYRPALSQARDISAAKAMPADIPAVVNHGAQLAVPVSPLPALAWFTTFAAVFITAAGASEIRQQARISAPISSRPHFSPPLFFRPPPSL